MYFLEESPLREAKKFWDFARMSLENPNAH
jgi:hypothetical protein